MKLCFIGTGYVGLVTGTCFAEVGHNVICVDNNKEKIRTLQNGGVPIFEPGLKELIARNVKAKRLHFTTEIKEGVDKSDVIFIAVPTPPQPDGSVDLSYVEGVAREIANVMTSYKIVVDKSTVPVKTGEKVSETIKRYNKYNVDFDVVSNPEFLREGCAIQDLMKPDRIVIGVKSQRAVARMREIFKPFDAPIIVTDINSAELIKHAANSFLALKISYINAVAAICEASGANVIEVANGMGMDIRIGRRFLDAGIGYGGSCFPKDLQAFIAIAAELGYDFRLLKEVQAINAEQMQRFLKKIRETMWVLKDKTFAVLGLAFKPNTDDIRNSPAFDLIHLLQKEGAKIRAYDPQAMSKAKPLLKGVQMCKDAYTAAKDADALIVATDWDEFKQLDLVKIQKQLTHPIIFDGRNIYDPSKLEHLGFIYKSVGR